MAVVRPAVTVAAKFTAHTIPNLKPSEISGVIQSGLNRLTPSGLMRSDATRSDMTRTNAKSALLSSSLAAPDLPLLDVDFCGECLPLDQIDVVDCWKHVFTLFRSHASDLGNIRQRADAFFPIIDPILEKYDIPDDFRYVPLAESALRPKAISRAGAAGYWQLMPATARSLGLRVSGRTDERFNVQKATDAACRYLRKLYDQLGSWSLVAAAYNAGPGLMKNQLKRYEHRDYYRMSLPRETKYYLYRVLLYKELLSRPNDYSSFLAPAPQTAYRFQPIALTQQPG
ncbi:lytic transglycosylase domain-containing protein [Spirosoma agri]|uniref:Lytic transglycosylase domain-containing protein n=1 Tax=Spirosoma agri TaxID=1987381 RepID=A0A6M0IMR8_9BACT|nr:lytic transglycosylase domain-containing protein [Spirosoma agri]NEU68203.1 lytic transglycosylase domain-containing protein [Spirosoma agri]